MDRSELDFYRIRFKVALVTNRSTGSTEYVWKEMDWIDHYPTFRDIQAYISQSCTLESEIIGIELEHEHYVRDKKEEL